MSRSTTVPIVEDEEALADSFGVWLQAQFEVHVTYSVKDALEVVAEEPIDVLLFDRRLPGLTGKEVLQSVREGGGAQQVVMMTAVQPGNYSSVCKSSLTRPHAVVRSDVQSVANATIAAVDVDDRLLEPIGRTELLRAVEAAELALRHEDSLTELLPLAARKAMLEATLDDTERQGNDRYGGRRRRARELQERADATLRRLETDCQVNILVRDRRVGAQPVGRF